MAVQLLGHLAEASTYGILKHNTTIPSMPQSDNFWIYDLFVESAHFEFLCFGCFFLKLNLFAVGLFCVCAALARHWAQICANSS